jgi:asparagine synthase (glutamine-hydrolysing)
MCGICGTFGPDLDPPLEGMGRCQSHRGPESTGIFEDSLAKLSNQRLRVIDVEGGDQPIYNEGGDVVVVYNGEIYNFESLREELRDAGHSFTTDTDTEILVHGYEEYGTELFGRLNGMFAAAIYDATDQRLLLVRDRAGIKPLYVAAVDGGLAFASEPKALLQRGLVDPAVDTDALRYFLQLRYTPSHTTLFEGIETVQPGTYLDVQFSDGEVIQSMETFWTLDMTPDSPPSDPVTAVREALRSAVSRQLVSDVPVGFYLSGGLDTSSVVAMASELSDDPIHTFCMGFDDSKWDEREDARTVANHFETIHHEIIIEDEFMRDFPKMIWHADEPKRNLYPYYVAEAMADHVTVALGGLGADELFAGYVYRFSRLQELQEIRRTEAEQTKASMKSMAESLIDTQLSSGPLQDDAGLEDMSVIRHLDDPAQLYVLLNNSDVIGDTEAYETRAFGEALSDGPDPAESIRSHWSPTDSSLCEQALEWDFTVKLPDDFLHVEDRMSMAHSLESRVPFLDNELIDLAFSIPFSRKFTGTGQSTTGRDVGKKILREAMSDLLPEAVFRKDKQGFTMPTHEFVRTELLDYAERILDSPAIVSDGLIQGSYVDTLLAKGPQRELTHHHKLLWKLVALEIWYRIYIVGGEVTPPQSIDAYYS